MPDGPSFYASTLDITVLSFFKTFRGELHLYPQTLMISVSHLLANFVAKYFFFFDNFKSPTLWN